MAKMKILHNKRTGEMKILDVEGGGLECTELTKNFEEALGAARDSTRQFTASYREDGDTELLVGDNG